MLNSFAIGHYVAFLLLLGAILLNVDIQPELRALAAGADGSELRVLLLTAHPDDECMFFGPTLLALTAEQRRGEQTSVYSLCLSSVDADGRGSWRKEELAASLDVLGVAPSRRTVLDEPFKDNITLLWNKDLVASYVFHFVIENNIDVILTFDGHGISSHPNHISLHSGTRVLLQELQTRRPHVKAYALESVPTLQKYTSLASALFAHIERATCAAIPTVKDYASRYTDFLTDVDIGSSTCSKYGPKSTYTSATVFVSNWERYFTTLQAMWQHKSQLVWFRYLYVLFSRYMWVNKWEEIIV